MHVTLDLLLGASVEGGAHRVLLNKPRVCGKPRARGVGEQFDELFAGGVALPLFLIFGTPLSPPLVLPLVARLFVRRALLLPRLRGDGRLCGGGGNCGCGHECFVRPHDVAFVLTRGNLLRSWHVLNWSSECDGRTDGRTDIN